MLLLDERRSIVLMILSYFLCKAIHYFRTAIISPVFFFVFMQLLDVIFFQFRYPFKCILKKWGKDEGGMGNISYLCTVVGGEISTPLFGITMVQRR